MDVVELRGLRKSFGICVAIDDVDLRVRHGEIRPRRRPPLKGRAAFRLPLAFSGAANKLLGPLFGYEGSFTVEERPCPAPAIPADVLPVREEHRE